MIRCISLFVTLSASMWITTRGSSHSGSKGLLEKYNKPTNIFFVLKN